MHRFSSSVANHLYVCVCVCRDMQIVDCQYNNPISVVVDIATRNFWTTTSRALNDADVIYKRRRRACGGRRRQTAAGRRHTASASLSWPSKSARTRGRQRAATSARRRRAMKTPAKRPPPLPSTDQISALVVVGAARTVAALSAGRSAGRRLVD